MALNDAGKGAVLTSGLGAITHLGLSSGAVGAALAELSGGSPAYARKAVAWAAASGGARAMSGAVVFDVPAGANVTRVTMHSAVTAGTFYGDGDVTDETYAGQGTYSVDSGSVALTG